MSGYNSGGGGGSASSSYQLIGTIDYTDVNTEVGNASFRELVINYDDKILESIYIKCIQPLDVDALNFNAYDTDTASSNGSFLAALNIAGKNQLIVPTGLTQTPSSTFEILCTFSGKGTIAGGNSTGEFEVYAKLTSI